LGKREYQTASLHEREPYLKDTQFRQNFLEEQNCYLKNRLKNNLSPQNWQEQKKG
jgi:hypothetical protein